MRSLVGRRPERLFTALVVHPVRSGLFLTKGSIWDISKNLRSARTCVGYLGRVKAQRIGAKMDRGFAVSAVVDRMRGTGMSGSPVGLVLPIYMKGDAPDLSDAASMDANASSTSPGENWPPGRTIQRA